MQNIRMKVPKEIKTKLDEMNLLDRFLFNETVEDVEVYNDIVEILMNGHISLLPYKNKGERMVMIKNGQMWLDDAGNPIQAHGGNIIKYENKWYWYGEHKGAENSPGLQRVDFIGISL